MEKRGEVSERQTRIPEIIQPRFEDWLDRIEEPNQEALNSFIEDGTNADRLERAPGSRGAHHAWEGGYKEYLRQTMMIAAQLFPLFVDTSRLDELPHEERFSLGDALVVMFLHDIEKMFMYDFDENGELVTVMHMTKADRKEFQRSVIEKYGFVLTPAMENALLHVEGVRDEYYIPGERVDQPLAALCHAADNLSARGFYDHKG